MVIAKSCVVVGGLMEYGSRRAKLSVRPYPNVVVLMVAARDWLCFDLEGSSKRIEDRSISWGGN